MNYQHDNTVDIIVRIECQSRLLFWLIYYNCLTDLEPLSKNRFADPFAIYNFQNKQN